MAGRRFAPVPGLRGRAGAGARRGSRLPRPDPRLRGAEGRAASRGDPPGHRDGGRGAARPGRDQGDDLRAPRLHRPQGRAGRARDRDDPPARSASRDAIPLTRRRPPMPFDSEITQRAIAVLEACRARGATVATVESCTGGLVGGALTAIPGSSDVVMGGLITYSNAAKTALAGVPDDLLAIHGAVSEPVARAMAAGGR
eukprot:gene19086-27036_t